MTHEEWQLLLLEFHGVKDLLKNQRDSVTATGKYLEDALEELELFIMKNGPKYDSLRSMEPLDSEGAAGCRECSSGSYRGFGSSQALAVPCRKSIRQIHR